MTEDGESRRERDVLERLGAALGFSVWEASPRFLSPRLRVGPVSGSGPFFTLPLSRPISGARPSLRTILKTFEYSCCDSNVCRDFKVPGWIPPGNSVDELELAMAAVGV